MEAPLSTEKYCVDCTWIAKNFSNEWEKYKCLSPENIKLPANLITGGLLYPLCTSVRANIELCGAEGKWFKFNEKKTEAVTIEIPRVKRTSLSALTLDDL